MPRGTAWIVGDGTGDCDHGTDRLRHVGDDGVNAYFQCRRCEAVIVSRIDDLVSISSGR